MVCVDAKTLHATTPLMLAARSGHVECVRALVQHGAEINASDAYQYTPLHWAASWGREACVRELLDAGAEVNVLNNLGETPEVSVHVCVRACVRVA